MRKGIRGVAGPLALAAALAGAAPAAGALPSPKSTTIVPGRSIADVRVGMTAAQALSVWGTGTDCTPDSRPAVCFYRGTDREGNASFTLDKTGTVRKVTIQTGRSGLNLIYKGPLQRWRTKRGIRLGSTAAQVVKAYPKAKGAPYGIRLGSGSHTTALATSSGRIYDISVGTID